MFTFFLRTYFIIDIVSTMPFYLLYERLYWFRILRFVRFDEANTRIIDFLAKYVFFSLILFLDN